ncbi:MAG: glycosyl transferase family protein, partial [Planctomycetes bacterium]|nr:glycosyl transferase family protein [Planctomycetota bacterium]
MHDYVYFVNRLLLFTAVAFLISSLDDFFIDAYYWLRRLYRWVFVRDRIKPVTLDQLAAKPEQEIAIMVPAWKEAEVIAQMLEANIRYIEYENYFFFVGVYQNDDETGREVDRMVAKYPNIRKVVVPHDGPTNKADCLNWIIQAIFLDEKKRGMEYKMIVMHDAEDVIHPYELAMYNYLVPRKDLIQIPVRCLEAKWSDFIRGSYIDEFSEFHTKDMVVRESLVGIVPSAGVSTCFSRRAISLLVAENESQPFNTDSLTEDYDISYRLSQHKDIKQIFVVFPVSVTITKPLYNSGVEEKENETIPIATAEYFPNQFVTAVRQKTRWNIGIFFQAAGANTWKGGLFHKYYFFHDRKGILVNILMLPAYFLMVNILILWFGRRFLMWPMYYFDLPAWLVYANSFLLLNRAFQRAYFSWHLYNWQQGLLSLTRIVFSNDINFCSTVLASYFYLRHLVTGKAITWDKTTHEYPSLQVLEKTYKRLGDLLLERRLIDAEQLGGALDEQRISHAPLGHILMDKGLVRERELLDALSSQMGYATGSAAEADLEQALALLPPEFMLEHRVFPLGVTEAGNLEVLTDRALPPQTAKAIAEAGYPLVVPKLVLDKALDPLLTQVSRRMKGEQTLGDILVAGGRLTPAQRDGLLARQRAGEGGLGSLALAEGLVERDELRSLLAAQAASPVGDATLAPAAAAARALLHPAIMKAHKVYPLDHADGGTLRLLATRRLTPEAETALREAGYPAVALHLVLDDEMERLLQHLE